MSLSSGLASDDEPGPQRQQEPGGGSTELWLPAQYSSSPNPLTDHRLSRCLYV